MKKALIIGAGGFVGNYLIHCLHDEFQMQVSATKLAHETLATTIADVYNLNILIKEDILNLLNKIRPDYIIHLAAQSSVGVAWKNPIATIDVNIKGSVNVLDSIRELDYAPRILMSGSGEEYGYIQESNKPISENTPLHPGNVYAATKACMNMISCIYTKAYDMNIVLTRAFNHIGPGQSPLFVVSDFCKQVAEIELGMREPVILVGNLAARRDFTDVRDVVRAYALLAQNGIAGETYNVGQGKSYMIQDILTKIINISNAQIRVEIDPAKVRPLDVPTINVDISKLQTRIGWNPEISLEQTLKDTLAYWRIRLTTN